MKFKLLSVVTIILALLLCINVDAAEFTGYIYKSDPIPDIYYYQHRDDTEEVKYDSHNFHTQANIHRRSTDGAVVYCIESWANLAGSGVGSFKETTDTSLLNLTKDQIDMIKRIAYFGYGYKDEQYDHTDQKWYALAQYLIWKVQAPNIDHYIVDSITSNKPIHKYDKDINEILELAKYGININKTTLDDMFVGETITINNPNGSREYNITSTDNINVEKDFNASITINPIKPGKSNFNLIDYYEFAKSFKFYLSDKFQDAMSVGRLIMKNYTYDFNVLAGCVDMNIYEVDKNNKNKKLNDIEFGLYAKEDIYINGKLRYKKDSLVFKSKSKDGKVRFDNLTRGKYYIKELSDMSQYYDDNKVIDIEIDDSIYQDYNLYYHHQKLKIKLKKMVSIPIIQNNNIDYSLIAKENIKFGIYNKSNELLQIEKTNIKGEVVFDLSIPYGNYYIKELEVDKKYNDNFLYELEFKRVGNTEYQIKNDIKVINYMKEGKVIIKKLNNDKISLKKVIIEDEYNKIIGKYITDKEGLIELNLPYGKYYLKELDNNEEVIFSLEFLVDKDINEVVINSQLKEEITNDTQLKEEITNNTQVKEEIISGEVVHEPNYNYKPVEVVVGKTGEDSYINLTFMIVSLLFLLFIGYDKKISI